MAKFKGKNLYLKDSQTVTFGTGVDSNIWWDGVANELRVDTVISGVDPTQDYHLTTKQYVDSNFGVLDWQDSVITISGSPPGGPSTGDRYLIDTGTGAWSGHDDDIVEWNGSAWTFVDPNEGFSTWVEDVDVVYVFDGSNWVRLGTIVDHGNLTGLVDDDHIMYVPTDASRGFTSTVSGIDPTQDYHLTTKRYIDSISGTLSDHGNLTGLSDDDHTQYVPTDASRGFTSTVSGIDPTQSYHLATKAYVDVGGIDRKGRQSIGNGVSQVDVSFTDLGHTNYTVNATLANTSDSPPSIYAFIVSSTTASGFQVTLMGDTDSANYVLHWSVLE